MRISDNEGGSKKKKAGPEDQVLLVSIESEA
jgi:hypothetical protein